MIAYAPAAHKQRAMRRIAGRQQSASPGASGVFRQSFTLTEVEQSAFGRLCARSRFHDAADIRRFWCGVAQVRGLDPASIIGSAHDPESFTALPLDHGKHWCWPLPLECSALPPPRFFLGAQA